MPDIDTLVRVLIVIVSTLAALGLAWFVKLENRWYAENVQPEPPPPLERALRSLAQKIRGWRKGWANHGPISGKFAAH